MKVRLGFVSNSSSSSYICEICGEKAEGWDLCLSEAGMVQCINGHTFCEEDVDLDIDDDDEEWQYDDEEWHEPLRDELPEDMCPICRMELFSDYDLSEFLEKKTGITHQEVMLDIKSRNKRRRVLHIGEYVAYVCKRLGCNPYEIQDEIRIRFDTYSKFKDYLNT